MKALAISLILFIIIIVIVIVNVIYMANAIDHMKALALEVVEGEDADRAISELMSYWKKHKILMALSVSLREIDIATEHLLCLYSAHRTGAVTVLHQSYELFCNALDDIGRYEKISAENIF